MPFINTPPSNGLGSNTSIQDAWNLAGKVAYVMQGKASEQIINSYNSERQPVGQETVEYTNKNLRAHGPVWEALGAFGPSQEVRKKQFAELAEGTPECVARRARLQASVQHTKHHF